MNSRFSLRRLKAVIHQNGGGEVSSKSQHPQHPTSSSNNGYTHIPTSGGYSSNPVPNNQQPTKPEPRPSKYRIKSKSVSEAEVPITPILDRTNSAQSTVTTTSKSSPTLTSHPMPSSSGGPSFQTNTVQSNNNQNNFLSKNNLTSAGLRLFSSPNVQTPQIVQSAREKSSGPVFTGFNSSSANHVEGQVINYTNNNIPMSSPITSRSRGDDGRNSYISHPSSSSGINSNNSTANGLYNGSSSGVNSNNGLPSGRTHRTSPYRVSQSAESNNSYTTNSAAIAHTTSSQAANIVTNQSNNKDYNNADSDDYVENISTMDAINRVVGNQPVYSGPDNFNGVLSKVAARLRDYFAKYDVASRGRRKFAVLVGGGSFNPLTRMHLRTYFLAKQCLEAKYGYVVLGSLLSPAHGATVRERYRTNPSEILPSPHRLAVAQLLVQNSKLLSVDPWEITRRRAMDYLSLLEHTQSIIFEQFPDIEIKVMFVCKPNMVPKLSPVALRDANFGVVTVCRTPESDLLRNTLSAKWNGVITVVEDTAILDASLDIITSRKVRDKMKAGLSVEQLVGEKINEYVQIHKLGPKMNGTEKWEPQEKILPNIASRPAAPALTSQYNKSLISAQNSIMTTTSGNNSVDGGNSLYNGEYSPDKMLLPINELSTLNMKHFVPSQANKGNAVSRSGLSSTRSINSGSGANNNNNGYTPSWMAEADV
mmetsp:Transcript_45153/g.78862  ORF Transcript_45153/g.78862 Transcript_45153/m.78862 type:complete len:705 (-) Transcript_45153:156-2270(-)